MARQGVPIMSVCGASGRTDAKRYAAWVDHDRPGGPCLGDGPVHLRAEHLEAQDLGRGVLHAKVEVDAALASWHRPHLLDEHTRPSTAWRPENDVRRPLVEPVV